MMRRIGVAMTDTLPDRFILYRRERDPATGKWNKIPCDHHGQNIDPHQPRHWMAHADAAKHATWDPERPAAPYGVGWVLNGDGWFFLDIDDARLPDGTWTHDAQGMFLSFGGALGEVSTSGNGLHILGRCDPSSLKDRRNKWNGDREFYTDGRFVALSKDGLSVIGDGTFTGQDWTEQLLRIIPQREFLGDLPEGRDPSYTGPEDDDELIAQMLRSASAASAFGGGVTVSDLWHARKDALARKYPDPGRDYDASAADSALMSHLAFWTGKDMPRMDRLFRRSALMRDKYGTREDYRRSTIEGAARMCKRVYDRPAAPPRDSGAARKSEVYLTVPEMMEHFEGCVYVRDLHRVLVPDGTMLKVEQFNATYGGHMFQMMPDGTRPTKKAFEAFTECTVHRFPQAKRPCFRPDKPTGEIVTDEVNIYRAPDRKVTPGDVSRFMDFMQRLLPDERDRTILLSWCASLVQNPGVKFQWAPVLQGVEGNGKSLIASCLSYIIGDAYSYEPRASQLSNQFISFDEARLLIIVEEFHMSGRRELLDDLKPRVTNRRVEVEGKGQDRRLITNTANWFFCTNHRDAVLKSRSDRRYCVFFTAQQRETDLDRDGMGGSYFPVIYEWLRSGGYAHVADYLLTYEIPAEFDPAAGCHRAPVTSTTNEAIEASTGGVEAEIMEAVDAGRVGFRGDWISTWALERLLREKSIRLSRPKMGEILRDLGYEKVGRTSREIMREEGQRPILWKRGGGAVDLTDYLSHQGPGYE